MKILSTKTLPATIFSIARHKEIALTCLDFIQINALPFSIDKINSSEFISIVFTSSNAVKYFLKSNLAKQLIVGKKIFSLSGKTADELRVHNIPITSIAENSEKLADAILQDEQAKSVLHPCGNLRLDTLQQKLENRNIRYQTLVVYETSAVNNEHNENFDAVMFFSPSGVESFCNGNNLKKGILYCCIGQTTAAAVREKGKDLTIIISTQTNAKSMIESIEEHLK